MSALAFGRLLYTDCRPGEGTKASPGYQIQAVSRGVSATQQATAIKYLLYEAQTAWIAEGRPAEDFPNGLAHSATAGYATSQSRYVGKEANGARQGNFLSDCILSDEPAPYGIIRPAQLWQAPTWRTDAWPTTVAEPLSEPIDLGPIDFDAIQHWLADGHARARTLERLLSVLEDPEGPRVVIKSDQPEDALFWIAAATILMPMEQALSVSFSVFVRSVEKAPHRVVAVPASLNPGVTAGSSRSRVFVIDALTDESDEIEVSSRASFWVRQLSAADEPFDVVEAVERAASYGGTNEQDYSDARVAAMAVSVEGWTIEDASGVGRWVQRALDSAFRSDAMSVIERLVTAEDVRLEDLRLLDQLAARGVVALDKAELRCRLFDAELHALASGEALIPERLPHVNLERPRAFDQGSAVVSQMLQATDRAVGGCLGLAWRHGLTLEPPTPALVARLGTFVSAWLAAPAFELHLDRWALSDLVTDELHQQTRGMVQSGHPDVPTLLPRVVSYLLQRPNDPADAFSMEVEACYTATLRDPDDRLHRVRRMLASLASGPELFYQRYQDSLMRWFAADPRTCVELVTSVPAEYALNPTVLKVATDSMLKQVHHEGLSPESLMTIDQLRQRDALPNDQRVRRIAASAVAVDGFLTLLEGQHYRRDQDLFTEHLKAIRGADEDVLRLSMPAFCASAGETRGVLLGQSILRFLHERSGIYFAETYAPYLDNPRSGLDHAHRMFAWASDTEIPAKVRATLNACLLAHYRDLPAPAQSDWRQGVPRFFTSPNWREPFDQLLDSAQKDGRRISRLWGRD